MQEVKVKKNLGRMEIMDLIDMLAEAKAVMYRPGSVALEICNCCLK